MNRGGPNPLAYLDRGVQIRCDTGHIATTFFVCSASFLFAAIVFCLQRSFFVCSASFLFALIVFCLQHVPCGPAIVALCLVGWLQVMINCLVERFEQQSRSLVIFYDSSSYFRLRDEVFTLSWNATVPKVGVWRCLISSV